MEGILHKYHHINMGAHHNILLFSHIMDLLVVTPSLPLDCFQSKSLVQLPVLSPNPVSYSSPSVSLCYKE
jgi:hypothetical protein